MLWIENGLLECLIRTHLVARLSILAQVRHDLSSRASPVELDQLAIDHRGGRCHWQIIFDSSRLTVLCTDDYAIPLGAARL